MKLINKLATAGAIAATALGLGAAGATAAEYIELSPNPYAFTGEQTSPNIFSASGLSVVCDTAEFTGNTANGTTVLKGATLVDRIPFHAEYDGCTIELFGIPLAAQVTTHSDWDLDYVSGDATNGVTADVYLTSPASGPAVEIEIPSLGCAITIDGGQTLSSVDASNSSGVTGVDLSANVTDITYDSDCFGVSPGSDGTYVGDVHIPGVTITDA